MTWISNYAKYLLAGISSIAVLLTCNNASAFNISQLYVGGVNYIDACYNGYRGYLTQSSSANASGVIFLNNEQGYECNGNQYYNTYSTPQDWGSKIDVGLSSFVVNGNGHAYVLRGDYGFKNFSYVQAFANGDQVAFQLRSSRFSDWSVYRSDTIDTFTAYINGQNIPFNEALLRHDSFTLFYETGDSQWYSKQFLGDFVLDNYTLYVDLKDNTRNVWLVDFYHKKAWSMYLDTFTASQLMFGLTPQENVINTFPQVLTFDYIERLNWTQGYNIVAGGDTTFPPTAGNSAVNNSLRTFTYQLDPDRDQPVFDSLDNSGSSVDPDEILTYEKCLEGINEIKNIASNEYACRNSVDPNCVVGEYGIYNCMTENDYYELYNYLRNYTGTGYYTGQIAGVSCTSWYNKTISKYEVWGDQYYSKFLTANDWSVDPNAIAPEDYCGSYPSSSSEQSRSCKYFGVGCSDGFSIGRVVDSVRYYFKPFLQETTDEFKDTFMSGYNYFGVGSCTADYYGKSYDRGNYALLFCVGWLVYCLYSVFKS